MPYEITNPRFFPGSISNRGLTETETGCTVDTTYGVNVAEAQGCLLIDHPAPGLATIALSIVGTVNGIGDTVRALYLVPPNNAAHITTQLVTMLTHVDAQAAALLIAQLRAIGEALPQPASDPEPDPEPDPDGPAPEQPAAPAEPEDATRSAPAAGPLANLPVPPNPLEEFMVPVHRPGDDPPPSPTLVDITPPGDGGPDDLSARRNRPYPTPHDMEAPAARTA